MVKVSSSVSASLLVLRSTGTSCIRDNILAAAFLLASFLDVPLPEEKQQIEIWCTKKWPLFDDKPEKHFCSEWVSLISTLLDGTTYCPYFLHNVQEKKDNAFYRFQQISRLCRSLWTLCGVLDQTPGWQCTLANAILSAPPTPGKEVYKQLFLKAEGMQL